MIDVDWYDDSHQILRYQFFGEWNWDEYFVALAQGREMQKTVQHMTCTINDMRQTDYLPPDFLEKARTVSQTRPLNSGIAVYISTDYYFSQVHEILCRLYPETFTRYPLVDTEAEALTKIDVWFQYFKENPIVG
jgi:hypothetical protein